MPSINDSKDIKLIKPYNNLLKTKKENMKFAALAPVFATAAAADQIKGYYSLNWGKGSFGPPGANAGVAFTGYTKVSDAIANYATGAAWCCPTLVGPDLEKPWIGIGGSTSVGIWNEENLKALIKDLPLVTAQYGGVVFDVEIVYGKSEILIPLFLEATKKAKDLGLKVTITVSHSAPYQADDPQYAVDLVKAWA